MSFREEVTGEEGPEQESHQPRPQSPARTHMERGSILIPPSWTSLHGQPASGTFWNIPHPRQEAGAQDRQEDEMGRMYQGHGGALRGNREDQGKPAASGLGCDGAHGYEATGWGSGRQGQRTLGEVCWSRLGLPSRGQGPVHPHRAGGTPARTGR